MLPEVKYFAVLIQKQEIHAMKPGGKPFCVLQIRLDERMKAVKSSMNKRWI
ncbi:MAG: hypothetical protein ACK5U7_02790 [Bacteroidota bacterium]|jgi:hypothetical protein